MKVITLTKCHAKAFLITMNDLVEQRAQFQFVFIYFALLLFSFGSTIAKFNPHFSHFRAQFVHFL